MSIPLRAACGAATVTLALASGPAALAADGPFGTDRAETPYAVSAAQDRQQDQRDQQVAPRTWSRTRARAALRARRLALLQRAVRKKRTAMTAKWDRRARRAVAFAVKQKGRPYVWGGTGGGGFDCSGLVQQAWRRAGVSIPRVTYDQYRRIRARVRTPRHLRPGDLVFFNHLNHVGMYLGRNRFIHAPHTGATVSVARLKGYYRQNYVGAVRPAWVKLPVVPTSLDG
ncbi:C40 family peptidase [Actinomadura atramentaria]|uniref:C40 family peptidase n=1 Tax=Actinomadura atramentaria TaxID=1990 RepID=UPI00068846E8|nr:C40 family peptidase [Actinomadura atramentaria]